MEILQGHQAAALEGPKEKNPYGTSPAKNPGKREKIEDVPCQTDQQVFKKIGYFSEPINSGGRVFFEKSREGRHGPLYHPVGIPDFRAGPNPR